MRSSRQRAGSRRIGNRSHRALRVQQMILARPEPQTDECARVWNGLALPSVIGLILSHGVFAGLVPRTRSLSAHVVLADQGFLNCLGSFRINFLLAAGSS